MKTWIEFQEAGVCITRSGQGPRVRGPQDDGIPAALRAAVASRVEAMRAPVRVSTARSGECDACAESLPLGRGGWCGLCELARHRALSIKKSDNA